MALPKKEACLATDIKATGTEQNADFTEACELVIAKTREALAENTEWIDRYSDYATQIKNNLSTIRSRKKLFREWDALNLYMPIGEAKGQMTFSLRYLGQDVAKLIVKDDKITITTKYNKKDFANTNKRDFDCDIELNDDWRSGKAFKFRQHFSNKPIKKSNHEHRHESLLLTEFSKKRSENKLILNIQPVKLEGIARFQMPTPLTASDIKSLRYAKGKRGVGMGGGIDIISRIGKRTKLCIMEVKDETKSSEPPATVILQCLAYGTFIQELLKSKSGQKWWEIFGFKTGTLPERPDIYIVCVMPDKPDNDISFADTKLITHHGIFHIHYLYFVEKENKFTNFRTSLSQCQVVQ